MFEHKRYEKLLKEFGTTRGPGPHIRAKLRWDFLITGQSIELLEARPRWIAPSKYSSLGFAKATFVNIAVSGRLLDASRPDVATLLSMS